MTLKRTTLFQIGPEEAPLWSLCDWRDPVSYFGNDFLPWSFGVTGQKTGKIEQTGAKVTLYDSENTFVTYGKTTGLTGVEAAIYHVKLVGGEWVEDTEYSTMILPIGEFYGQHPNVVMELSASYGWDRTPGIPMGDHNCRHILGGLRCQYPGADLTCARSREHCRLVKLNLRHFGGHNRAPEPGSTYDLGPVQTIVPDSPIGGRTNPPDLGGDSGTGVEAPPPDQHNHIAPSS